MNKHRIASELFHYAKEQGGVTVDRYGDVHSSPDGYVIGGSTFGLHVSKDTPEEDALDLVVEWLDFNPANYYGSWVDGDIIFFDGCDVIYEKDLAIKLGKERNQLAIWDIKNGEEIWTDEKEREADQEAH